MLRRLSFLLFAMLWTAPALGQAPNDWQQHVAYEMDVTLQADRHRMHGTQRVTYTNNSPDTLRTVFYHLYFNAFHPNSMMAERNRHLPDPDGRVVPRIFDLDENEIGYHEVESLTQDGQSVDYEITDTVLRVDLARPIPPGASTSFAMRFHSQVPLQTRRSGRDNDEGIDYSMSQWYPKIAEYDERGWHADPYVGREFYAPYGSFDVQITLPADYTVGATGVLQNPNEVGHGYDIDDTGTYRPSDGTDASTDSLTWHFRADDVHDFAWAADPDYIHERIDVGDGRIYHLLYEGDVEDRWQLMRQWVPQLIQFFSGEYGPYPYPQFTVAQAGDGGMEYPMINFLTGERSLGSLLGVTAHEAAHEWFYAVLGTNEADYAWIDEGFTSYATAEGVAHIQGIENPSHTGRNLSVIRAQDAGIFERFNTPADWFTTNTAYSIASYSGGAMLVDMMGYVISDSLRDAWLKEIYDRRAFQHPDPFDLEKFAENVSGLQLDWYFEQYTNMTRRLDYAVAGLDQERAGDSWQATVSLERKDEIAMPIDVQFTLEDGSTQWVTIPLGIMQGHKPVPDDWLVADPWLWTFPEYTLTVDLPARATSVEIDPEGRMPDYNRLNNTNGFPRTARFLQPAEPSWFEYGIGYRPLVQYAHDFGPGIGLQTRGQYLFGDHRFRGMIKLWPQVLFSGGDEPETLDLVQNGFVRVDATTLSAIDGLDYKLVYTRRVRALRPEATLSLSARKHLGFLENRLTVETPLGPPITAFTGNTEQRLTAHILHQYNPTARVFDTTDSWWTQYGNPFQYEHMASVRLDYRIENDADWLAVGLELGGSIRDVLWQRSANRFSLSAGKSAVLGAFTGRATVQLGLGARNLAEYKRFRLGGTSHEARWRNDAFRSLAAAFADPLEDAHLVDVGPSGPVAYLRSEPVSDSFMPGATGNKLIAGRLSLYTPPLQDAGLLQPLQLGLFSGVGTAWSQGAFLAGFDADDLLADAGLAVDYDVAQIDALNRWTAQSDVLSHLRITARFPLWASDPGRIESGQDAFTFRWLLGIEVGL